MAVRLYRDAAGTDEITSTNPDRVRKAVPVGQDLVDEQVLYLRSDDPTLTYEGVSIWAEGDEDDADQHGEVAVFYALDKGGSPGEYKPVLDVPDGDFVEAVPIWRKVVAPGVQAAFRRVNIVPKWTQNEYVK